MLTLHIVNPVNMGVLSCLVGDLYSLSVHVSSYFILFCISLLFCLFTWGTCMLWSSLNALPQKFYSDSRKYLNCDIAWC